MKCADAMRLRSGLVISCALLAACSVGPEYRTPSVSTPSAYKEPPPSNFKENQDWKQAEPQDATLRGKWWKTFGDSILNSLEDQVDISNQDLAGAEARFRAARAAIRVTRADLFPTISAGANTTTSRTSPARNSVLTSGTGTFYQLPADFSYEADVWGRIRHDVESSIATTQATAADLETLRLSVHAELASDYFQIRGLDEESRLYQASIAAYEQALQLTKNRYDQGVVPQSDVVQAQNQLDTIRAQATDLGVQRSEFEHAIAVLMGKQPEETTIDATDRIPEPPAIPVGLPSELLERRPDIASAERRVASANADIGAAQAAFFPRLTLSLSGGLESSKLAKLLSWPGRFWSIGPALAETAFDAGRRRGITEEAQANYDSTVATYRQNVLNALQDVEDNLASLRILSDEAAQQDAAVASAQRALELALNRYRGGITTFLEVITAQNALLGDQRGAVELRTRRMSASVSLIKALGGSWNVSDLPSPGSLVPKKGS